MKNTDTNLAPNTEFSIWNNLKQYFSDLIANFTCCSSREKKIEIPIHEIPELVPPPIPAIPQIILDDDDFEFRLENTNHEPIILDSQTSELLNNIQMGLEDSNNLLQRIINDLETYDTELEALLNEASTPTFAGMASSSSQLF